ncbi:TetR/AcrR family transcriptional regulator [Streptomyces sp. NBC_01537]|uniref:hypothetical protein n=1 Tax=Streptomyces sp. NBC_01537 TaxID=2903896 RepID=UPI00386AF76B
MAEFALKGYYGTSATATARRAGVTQPHLFRLAAGRKAIVAALTRSTDDARLAFESVAKGMRGCAGQAAPGRGRRRGRRRGVIPNRSAAPTTQRARHGSRSLSPIALRRFRMDDGYGARPAVDNQQVRRTCVHCAWFSRACLIETGPPSAPDR